MNRTRGASETARVPLDLERIRADFPQLAGRVHGKPLVYLDNAATAQKPRVVLEALEQYYERECSNVHRGLHQLSVAATERYERTRERARELINASDSREIIFVRGTTEAINLVASSYGSSRVGPGDEVLITGMEHHSNIVPWQLLCGRTGATLKVVPVLDDGTLDMEAFERLLGPKTRIVSVVHVSNVLGTRNPVRRIIELAHARNVPVMLDGAQAMAHDSVDVRALDCDFYAFSSHKMFGPTGIGVLYGKAELLESMPPYQGGGDMIETVSFEKTTYNELPYKFEAGTPDIAGVIGLGAAIEYVRGIGLERIREAEVELGAYAAERIGGLSKVRLIGTAPDKAPVFAFRIEDVHPHDIATVLDLQGVAVRAGHHCCQPLMERFGVGSTVRVSLAFYNTREEIDAMVAAMDKVFEVFRQ